jgi:hypothetical protein
MRPTLWAPARRDLGRRSATGYDLGPRTDCTGTGDGPTRLVAYLAPTDADVGTLLARADECLY